MPTVMHIRHISIEPSRVIPNNHILVIECANGYKFTGAFDNNLMAFMAAVSGALKYFGEAYGQITIDSDGTARPTPRRKDGYQ
jgi:hypothetical protein